uniref:Gypsy retrotransposon integrase-like protein 1 n=1 Tax=Paramormyrops kingsleyae TaxID=1676925 RepID=A0A3B3R4L1_9TELE
MPRRLGLRPLTPPSSSAATPPSVEKRECYYCHEVGHIISVCPALKRKNARVATRKVQLAACVDQAVSPALTVDSTFQTFVFPGTVSLGETHVQHPVTILRDTGAAQSFLVDDILPLDETTYCGTDVLVQGIALCVTVVPLHTVYLRTPDFSGYVRVAVQKQLPVSGVTLVLGNDIAGGRLVPLPEVNPDPAVCENDVAVELPTVFPACVLTRAQRRRLADIDLADTFMSDPALPTPSSDIDPYVPIPVKLAVSPEVPSTADALIAAQGDDPSLEACRASAVDKGELKDHLTAYYHRNGVLMRKWAPPDSPFEWATLFQVVVPGLYREYVLSLAHDHPCSGHLGVRKTLTRLLAYFFWRGVNADVKRYCRSCHACQVVGKPNQTIASAPLRPIPAMGEPFEHVLIDCVGPLPRTRSGNCYLFTLMCTATRFPEAIPIRSLRTPVIVKHLIKFFTTFGLPRRVQSDQGSNFMSKLFAQVVRELGVCHTVSSAYHPESQGALERFHQSFKNMLRIFCLDAGKEWDEGVPLLLFAIRGAVQEATGFSPAELVFGHTARGPLKIVQEQWLSPDASSPMHNVSKFVTSLCERMSAVREFARRSLGIAQEKMKGRFDESAKTRCFHPGERVLVLLPLPGSSLRARFSGPYVIREKLSPTNYVLETPDRRRKSRICHVNMLKPYLVRSGSAPSSVSAPVPTPAGIVSLSQYSPESDDFHLGRNCLPCARLPNSEALRNLMSRLSHLPRSAQSDVTSLIERFRSLFADVPSRTPVIVHDIDVGDHLPIKQHPYRVNPRKRALLSQETTYLLDTGLAVPSKSPWSSPCLLVPKPDGTFRFCTDYRKLNAVTRPDAYPLPRMEDCVDHIGSAEFVTKL